MKYYMIYHVPINSLHKALPSNRRPSNGDNLSSPQWRLPQWCPPSCAPEIHGREPQDSTRILNSMAMFKCKMELGKIPLLDCFNSSYWVDVPTLGDKVVVCVMVLSFVVRGKYVRCSFKLDIQEKSRTLFHAPGMVYLPTFWVIFFGQMWVNIYSSSTQHICKLCEPAS